MANVLLRAAKDNLHTAEQIIEGGLPKHAAFFAQQAAETALKAVLIQEQGRLERIHDVAKLARAANLPTAFDRRVAELNHRIHCQPLSRYGNHTSAKSGGQQTHSNSA